MYLYLVERTDPVGYDDYDSFVCWAKSGEDARKLHPYGDDSYLLYEDGWHMKFSDGRIEDSPSKYNSWTHAVSSLKVWELSRPPKEPTVVLASYNAG